MTRIETVYSDFTDASLFHPYDDNASYARRNVGARNGSLHLAVDAGVDDSSRGFGGWLGPKALTYGSFEVTMQSVGGSGTGMVLLLWPTSDRWAEGEVDAFEGDFGARLDVNVHRRIAGREAENGYQRTTRASWYQSHTYGIVWRPDCLSFSVDGEPVGFVDDPALIPTTPHRLTLQSSPRWGSSAASVLVDSVVIAS